MIYGDITDRLGTQLYLSRSGGMLFENPEDIVQAAEPGDVLDGMSRVQEAVARGWYAAGWVSYEAGPAFDAAFAMHAPCHEPVMWFGLYRDYKALSPPKECDDEEVQVGPWRPLVSEARYLDAIRRIRAYIEAGDVYQVNYTFPLEAAFRGDALAWFLQLCRAQEADYCAYVNAGRYRVLSASPELFFRLDGNRITTRPMKGTRPRGRWLDEDRALAKALCASEKERAENVMIVDLLRNDLGRIARRGTVNTTELFAAERYPTVWQLTSTVTAETDAPLPELFRALFPCGSITGAPKVRMTQIARELEPYPRGVYCGSVGWWGPERKAQFNVAIRTVVVDTNETQARYGVGGGITWESSPKGEYEECRIKARFLTRRTPSFELLESLLWEQGAYFLRAEHLDRLMNSAEYFGWPLERERLEAALDRLCEAFDETTPPQKVRLLVNQFGALRVTHEAVPPEQTIRLGFARHSIHSSDPFLFHKTTHRQIYENAKASRPDCDDVLLWNERGEITESAIANVVLEDAGRYLTPPVASGLLGGVFRRRLLEDGLIEEALLMKADVARADRVWLVNSVRKWIPVQWVDS